MLMFFYENYQKEQKEFSHLGLYFEETNRSNYYKNTRRISNLIKSSRRKIIDLSPYFPPVVKQGLYGICNLTAVLSMIDFQINGRRRFSWSMTNKHSLDFLWYQSSFSIKKEFDERSREIQRSKVGVDTEDIILNLKKYGICTEEDWPTRMNSNILSKPSLEVMRKASCNKPNVIYLDKFNLSQWIDFLDKGYAIKFSIDMAPSFSESARKGDNFVNNYFEQLTSMGHAMVIVGYDNAHPKDHGLGGDSVPLVLAFKIRNSWGENRHDNGYFWMNAFDLLHFSASIGRKNPFILTGLNNKTVLGFKEPRSVKNIKNAIDFLKTDSLRKLAYIQKEYELIELMRSQFRLIYNVLVYIRKNRVIHSRQVEFLKEIGHWEKRCSILEKLNRKIGRYSLKDEASINQIEKFMRLNTGIKVDLKFESARQNLSEDSIKELDIYIKQSLILIGGINIKSLKDILSKEFEIAHVHNKRIIKKTLCNILMKPYSNAIKCGRDYNLGLLDKMIEYMGIKMNIIDKTYAEIKHLRELLILSHKFLDAKSIK